MDKKTRSADICADRIDVITNFAVITNAVIKRVHCNMKILELLIAMVKDLPICITISGVQEYKLQTSTKSEM